MKSWIKALLLLRLNICIVKGFTETKVSCVHSSSCILPCSFRYETHVLHWRYVTRTGHDEVHSYYEYRDQFVDQDPRYEGRTSLVEDQVTGRKTALMLKNVKVQDEGKYRCYADCAEHGNKSSTVVLEVDAPVQRVDMVRAGNSVTCSSEGVYPEPELTWSSSPQSSPTVQQTEEKLYNISSSLELPDVDGDLLLNCTVSTRLNKRTTTTTWRNPKHTHTNHLWLFGVVVAVLIAAVIGISVYRWKRHKASDHSFFHWLHLMMDQRRRRRRRKSVPNSEQEVERGQEVEQLPLF